MITREYKHIFAIAIDLGWTRDSTYKIDQDITQFYKTYNIDLTNSSTDDSYDLSFPSAKEESIFRIQHSIELSR